MSKLVDGSDGFTLIELITTITIIGILATIAMLNYQNIFKGGRDAKRQSDLKQIQSALQHYFSDQNFYPTGAGLDLTLSTGAVFTSSTGNPSPPSQTKTYLRNLPQDPTGTDRYRFEAYPISPTICNNDPLGAPRINCTGYCLYARLENPPNPLPPAPAPCTYPAGYNLAVVAP